MQRALGSGKSVGLALTIYNPRLDLGGGFEPLVEIQAPCLRSWLREC